MSPSATPAMQSAPAPRATKPDQARHTVPWVPRLTRKTTVNVTKCHACHAKCRGAPGDQAGPSAPHSTMSTTPATWNDGGCHQVPRLPHETKVNVTKCHDCHAKCRGAPGDQAGPSAPHSTMSATPATWNEGECHQVPRLPRETKVNVTKCHACHAKCRGAPGDQAGPSAPHSTMSATPATWNEGECHQVPRLPRETKVNVTKFRACHAKCRGAPGDQAGPSAPHSTMSATPATQNDGGCHQVPRLPRKVKVNVTKCRACHAKCRGAPGDQAGPSAPHSTMSTTPATWNEGECHQVPRLPRETKVNVTKCHAFHAKCRGAPGDQAGPSAPHSTMSAMPATWNDGGCELVPRLPRETTVDVTKCHACHAKCRGAPGDQAGPSAPHSTMSATPATWNDGGCELVPRLPRETTVDVTKCHACHAKCRGAPGDQSGPSAPHSTMSATPATQNDGGCECVCVCVCVLTKSVWTKSVWTKSVWTKCVFKVCVDKECVDKVCVDKECVDKVCVDKVCVDKECVDKECVDKVCVDKVCVDKVYVNKVCVDKVYVNKVCVDKVCVDKVCVDKECVDKVCVDKVCVDKECVDKVCVDKVCVDKECVDKECVVDKVCVDRRAGGGGEGGGIQNQKQEPHTKLWGIIVFWMRLWPWLVLSSDYCLMCIHVSNLTRCADVQNYSTEYNACSCWFNCAFFWSCKFSSTMDHGYCWENPFFFASICPTIFARFTFQTHFWHSRGNQKSYMDINGRLWMGTSSTTGGFSIVIFFAAKVFLKWRYFWCLRENHGCWQLSELLRPKLGEAIFTKQGQPAHLRATQFSP